MTPSPKADGLFTPTVPDESGFYWWRGDDNVTDQSGWEIVSLTPAFDRHHWLLMWRFCETEPEPSPWGQFGPKIPLPVAPPVECEAVIGDTGTFECFQDGKFKSPSSSQRFSGVFVPTAFKPRA